MKRRAPRTLPVRARIDSSRSSMPEVRRLASKVVIALVIAALGWSPSALAQTLDAALPKLIVDDTESLKQGVTELGDSGNPKALPILYALRDGKLKVDDAMA